MHVAKTGLFGVVTLCCALLVTPLSAQSQNGRTDVANTDRYLSLPDPAAPYPFVSRGLDIQDALKIFAKNLRIGAEINETITGPVPDRIDDRLNRIGYVDALALEFDFVWYFDGRVLRISPVGSIETEILPLQNHSGAEVLEILKQLDIYQQNFTHRSDLRNRTFLVSGPADYVALVKKAVEAIEAAEKTNITVLRGAEGGIGNIATVGVDKSGGDAAQAPTAIEPGQ